MAGEAAESTFSSASAVAFSPPPPPCDVLPTASLSAADLLEHLVRVTQTVFHHLPVAPSSSPAVSSVSSSPRVESRKRRRASASSPPALCEEAEAAAVSAVSCWPLSPFLASPPSPSLFHRLAIAPPPSSFAPRFAESLAGLRAVAVAHVARLRSAPSAASLDRLAFFSSSLTSLRSQQTAVQSALRLCRSRLRAEGQSTEATAKGQTAFAALFAQLQAIKAELGLQSAEDAQALERSRWVEERERGDGALSRSCPTVGVHLASGGSSGCFVVELELRREGATFADVLQSVRAEFLQGEAELRDAEVDAELRQLLCGGRFALLRRKLAHLLSLEATSDRHPQRSLFALRQPAEEALRQLQQRTQQPSHVSSALDGVQLAFHHRHLPSADAQVDAVHLFAAPAAGHLRFPSHPSVAFTHSLTWIGVTEPLQPFPSSPPSTAPSPAFCSLFSVWPPIVLPSSSLQRLMRLGVARHAHGGSSHSGQSSHSASASPALSYHEAVLRGGLVPTAATAAASDAGGGADDSPRSSPTPCLSVFGLLHEYRVVNDATAVDAAGCVAYLALHSLAALPDAVHLLRQSAVFQQLYASLFQPHPDCMADGDGEAAAVLRVEVSAFPPHSLRLRFAHPLQSGATLTVDVRVASVASAEPCRPVTSSASSAAFDCHVLSASIERSFDCPFPCSDQFATDALCATHSIPMLVHALHRRARQHTNTRAQP